MKILLITGFLGAGKTTLLNRILSNPRGKRFAVVVNDLGDVNIDAELIQRHAIAGIDDDGQLIALENGCICCSLKADLQRQIIQLAKGPFDYIVIEASGVCTPQPIAKAIAALRHMRGDFPADTDAPLLDCITTVVDAHRMYEEFNIDGNLSATLPSNAENPLTNLLVAQIEFANIVLLNKVSIVSHEVRRTLHTLIHALIPSAEIIECDHCDVPLDTLLDTGRFHFDQLASSARWVRELERPVNLLPKGISYHPVSLDAAADAHHHHDLGIEAFTYFRRRPFSLMRFDEFMSASWPKDILRCKGLVYFAENPNYSYIFEQAGTQRDLQEAGKWYASAPEEELQLMLAQNPALAEDWDPEYGDRMIKLVFIGRNLDTDSLVADLDAL